jgi:hypothetical protein
MTGIVVPMDCTHNNLECMIFSVMKRSVSTQRIKMQYRVKKNLPLMEILDDISLTFYLELKMKDKDLASFPLCVDVTTVSKSHDIQCLEAADFEKNEMMQLQFCEVVTDNSATSIQKLPSMEEIAVDV